MMTHPRELRRLCLELEGVMEERRLLIVPGGGLFADAVRNIDAQLSLTPRASHLMALTSMNAYGLLLADLAPRARLIERLDEAEVGSAIILPYHEASQDPELPMGWETTGDAVAARFAERLGVKLLILLKDVDGLLDGRGRLIEEVEASRVEGWSCLDPVAPRIIERAGITCLVLNGLVEGRLTEALRGGRPTMTLIKP